MFVPEGLPPVEDPKLFLEEVEPKIDDKLEEDM